MKSRSSLLRFVFIACAMLVSTGGCGAAASSTKASDASVPTTSWFETVAKPSPAGASPDRIPANLPILSTNGSCNVPFEESFGQSEAACGGMFPSFTYSVDTGECVGFPYGGCGGRGNRFDTLAQCRAACMQPTP